MSEPSLSFEDAPTGNELASGSIVGEHRVELRFAEGGVASLYLARHVQTGDRAALKVMHPHLVSDRELCARFARELAIRDRLRDAQHVVQIRDAGELSDGRRFLVMEFLPGADLRRELDDLRQRGTSMDVHRACRIGRDLARALRSIHAVGLVHRALEPGNVMLRQDAHGNERAWLFDFGLSADFDRGTVIIEPHRSTRRAGHRGYWAPEQAQGAHPSPEMDVFALGATLFEMITGERVPPRAHVVQAGDVTALRPGIPAGLDRLVVDCLSSEPAGRPRVETLEARLEDILDDYDRPSVGVRAWNGSRPSLAVGEIHTDDRRESSADVVPFPPKPRRARARPPAPSRRRRRGALLGLGFLLLSSMGAVSARWMEPFSSRPTVSLPHTESPALPPAALTPPLDPRARRVRPIVPMRRSSVRAAEREGAQLHQGDTDDESSSTIEIAETQSRPRAR